MSHSSINKNSYDQIAAHYAEDHGKILAWQAEIDSFIGLLKHPGKILDLGCGHGDETIYLANKLSNAHVIGVDFADNMIEIASSKKTRVDFKTADITSFNPNIVVDGLWARASLHHLNDTELGQLLSAVATYLHPDSLFAMINKYGTTEEIEEKQKYGSLLKRYFNYFDEDKVSLLAKTYGYSLLKQYKKSEGGHIFLVSFLRKI